MSNKHLLLNYYGNQIGRGIAPYSGLSRISGHGYGSMLKNIFRFISPLVSPAIEIIKKEAVDSGLKILGDVAQNRPIKPTLKKHLANAGRNIIQTSIKRLQGGKNNNINPKKTKKRQSRSKHRRDIFT